MILPAVLVRNWPLKLTSLLLAVVLWSVAAFEEPGSKAVELRLVVQPPDGRTLLRPPPPVTAILTGPRRELFQIGDGDIPLTRVVPDTVGSRAQLELTPSDIALPRGLELRVQDLYPQEITIHLDALEERTVAVRPTYQSSTDSGFDLLGNVQVIPAHVRLSGPREVVSGIDTLPTVPLDLGRLQGSLERRVAVDTSGLGTAQVMPSIVTVRGQIQPVTERTLVDIAVQLPAELADSLAAERERVSVVVRGERSRLATLTADSVLVIVEPASVAGAPASLRVVVPPGLRGHPEPDTVRLTQRDIGPRG